MGDGGPLHPLPLLTEVEGGGLAAVKLRQGVRELLHIVELPRLGEAVRILKVPDAVEKRHGQKLGQAELPGLIEVRRHPGFQGAEPRRGGAVVEDHTVSPVSSPSMVPVRRTETKVPAGTSSSAVNQTRPSMSGDSA